MTVKHSVDGSQAVPGESRDFTDPDAAEDRQRTLLKRQLVDIVVHVDDFVGLLEQPGLRFLETVRLLAYVRGRADSNRPASEEPDRATVAGLAFGPVALGFGVHGVFSEDVAVGLDGDDAGPMPCVRRLGGDCVALVAVAVDPLVIARDRPSLVANRADEPIDAYQAELEDEIADVLIYLVRLCDVAGVDPMSAANEKIDRNAERFPANRDEPRSSR